MRSIELFTGTGGLALGLAKAGFEHSLVADWDRHACATLIDNSARVPEMTDWEVYEEGTMNGGLAFSEEKIKYLLSEYFECVEFRALEKPANEEVFGVLFLWGSLWKKRI